MEKSPEAFRTISEVADLLDTPAHVLRFWESRFPQIRPVKRAGGRRYYRPGDVALLAGIKKLLHDDGLTIRGVQKILREQGIRHVSGLTAPFPDPVPGAIDLAVSDGEPGEADQFLLSALMPPDGPKETAQIIPLDQAYARQEAQRGLVASATDGDGAGTAGSDGAREGLHGSEMIEPAPEAPFIEAEEEVEDNDPLPLFGFSQGGPEGVSGEENATDTASPPLGEPSDGNAAIESLPPVSGDDNAVEPSEPEAALEGTGRAAEAAEPEFPTVASLLRRSRARRLAPHRAELERLRDRLADLRDRVAEASRRRIR